MSTASDASIGVTGGTGETVKTDIPARLDRLPWSRWHWIVVVALGITWILDGLEVTLVGSISGALTSKDTLHLSTSQATAAGSFYLAGAVAGALLFGYLTDRFGRRKLFMVTLGIYLLFTVATALSWNFWSFMIFRVLADPGSAASTPRSTRRSTSSSRHASAAASRWRSTAPGGWERRRRRG